MWDLATQDGKIRIHYEDESVKVYHQVEYYQMKFDDREKREIESIRMLYQIKPISFKMQKNPRTTNNFEWDKTSDQINIERQEFATNQQYSFTDNKIVAIYFGGKEIYMRNRPKKKVKK